MSIEITLDPVTLAKVEKSAALAGLSTSQFLENFFFIKGRSTMWADTTRFFTPNR